jgi:predicted metalloprotease with PDZ domain
VSNRLSLLISGVGTRLRRLLVYTRAGAKCRFTFPPASRTLVIVCLKLVVGLSVNGQSHIQIQVEPGSDSKVVVEYEVPDPIDGLLFRDSYAGVIELGNRIESVEAVEASGKGLKGARVGPGEFRFASKAKSFRYVVNLTAPTSKVAQSHVSWLTSDLGLLMLGNLMPNSSSDHPASAQLIVDFVLPARWSISSAIRTRQAGHYLATEPEKAVFFVGRSLREKVKRIGSMEFAFVTSSTWAFSDDEALKIAERVINGYAKVTGYQPAERAVVMLAPLTEPTAGQQWSAETRGSTVVLVLGEQGTRALGLGHLGVVFTHELFHLWVPNGLNLSGDYDWFFEGFTLYQALRMALRLGFIDFDEFLKTISRVYASYMSFPDRDKFSLIEASERRWTGFSSVIYDKGMLLAFLYDLSLRFRTGNKSSIDDIYRSLFRLTRSPKDSNKTILEVLNRFDETKEFTRSYIEGKCSIELPQLVESYGISLQPFGSSRRLVINKNLSSDQEKLLHSLGYRF